MDALQTSIAGALEADQKKTQINDAKLRAVSQRVDYDEFCKLVAGAHLKPVKPCSSDSRNISKPFDQFVLPKYEPSIPARGTAAITTTQLSSSFEKPTDLNDFTRTWRRKCKTDGDKLKYLRVLDVDALPILFRTEMDPVILDGIVEALHTMLCEPVPECEGDILETNRWALRLLTSISRLNRFETTITFAAGPTEKKLAAIFDSILVSVSSRGDETDGELDTSATAIRDVRARFRV
eukprot:scaffold307058_cov39-Tisochrysis_lutea.AAC.1